MGDRSRFISSSGLRLLLRLVSAVAALVVLSISSRAMASPLTAVPMCGDHNESVAAPPIFRSVDSSSLQAPCQPLEVLGIVPGAPLAPERVSISAAPERVLPFAALRISQVEGTRLFVPRPSFALDRPGFVSELLRPPRA